MKLFGKKKKQLECIKIKPLWLLITTKMPSMEFSWDINTKKMEIGIRIT